MDTHKDAGPWEPWWWWTPGCSSRLVCAWSNILVFLYILSLCALCPGAWHHVWDGSYSFCIALTISRFSSLSLFLSTHSFSLSLPLLPVLPLRVEKLEFCAGARDPRAFPDLFPLLLFPPPLLFLSQNLLEGLCCVQHLSHMEQDTHDKKSKYLLVKHVSRDNVILTKWSKVFRFTEAYSVKVFS